MARHAHGMSTQHNAALSLAAVPRHGPLSRSQVRLADAALGVVRAVWDVDILEQPIHLLAVSISAAVALALVWFDFVLVILETIAVVLLIWGAAKVQYSTL